MIASEAHEAPGETHPMIDIDRIDVPAFAVEVLGDRRFRYLGVNAACRLRTGLSDEAIRGRTPEECQEPALAARVVKRYVECVERGDIVEYDVFAQFPGGPIDWRTWLLPISDPTGKITCLLGICNDMSLQEQVSDLRATNRQLSIALQALKGASWTYDVAADRFVASDAFALLMGEDAPRPVSWAEWCARILPEDLAIAFCDRLVAGQGDAETVLFRFRRNGGEVRWAQCRRMAVQEEALLTSICGVVVDVTEERRREEMLLDQASRDALTGLFNRRGFKREAERIVLCRPEGKVVALFLVDLDLFKATNDTFGHPAGDAVLTEVSRRLSSVLGRDAICARLGGDEFIALHLVASEQEIAELRVALSDAMAWPFAHEGRRIPMSASVGFATAGGHVSLGELMVRADDRLYADKRSGRPKTSSVA